MAEDPSAGQIIGTQLGSGERRWIINLNLDSHLCMLTDTNTGGTNLSPQKTGQKQTALV